MGVAFTDKLRINEEMMRGQFATNFRVRDYPGVNERPWDEGYIIAQMARTFGTRLGYL
jgi:hypothetical protein